jgi:outer membrane protein assembly factor BamB
MRRTQALWSALEVAVLLLGVLLAGCGGTATSQRQTSAPAVATSSPTATNSPALPSAGVYFGGRTTASNGTMGAEILYALDPASGVVRWSTSLGRLDGVHTTAAGGAVYATASSGEILALNATDGSVRWQAKGHTAADAQPLADDAALYIGSAGGSFTHAYVDAYGAVDGRVLWERDLGVLQSSQLALAPGVLYVGTQNTLTALRTMDGSAVWSISLPWAAPPPYVIGDAVYLNDHGDVRAFNAANGSPKWHRTPAASAPMGDVSVSGTAGLVYAGNGPVLSALHAANGSVAWNTTLQRVFFGTSAYNQIVYVSPGPLVALDATTGRQLWSVALSGDYGAPPILSDGRLIEGRSDSIAATQQPSGYIYALNPTDGSVMWKFAHPHEVYTNLTVT